MILGYFAFAAVLILGWWTAVPGARRAGSPGTSWRAALLVYEVKRPNRTSWVFRNWYPLPYVAPVTGRWRS